MAETNYVGQRLSFDGALCTVRYIGEVAGTSGAWLGVEWDDQARGKHDGSHKGARYFTCMSKSPTAASFVRPTRRADQAQSFIAALNEKYASDKEHPDSQIIIISGKVAEEMGFDKIRRKQAQVKDLRIVILDGMRIAFARGAEDGSIGDTCPSINQLDLSRNLLEQVAPVVEVCRELQNLRSLSISGNRFRNVLDDESLKEAHDAFRGVKELSIEDSLLGWDELCQIASKCTSLTSFKAGSNQLSSFPAINYSTLTSTLTSLNLEYNEIATLADLSSLTALTSLRNLHLKGNNIKDLAPDGIEAPVFPPSLQYLDVSYNNIEDWSFVDRLPSIFPGLTGLRLAHNPVYEMRDANTKSHSSEDAHMFTIARVASLKSLNFTVITPTDRSNAEMFYLSRIAKQLASVPESAEEEVKSQHPRYGELCELYGEPDVIRRDEINPSYLEARLVTISFRCPGKEKKTTKIPKSFDIYSVKGIAGKLFGASPLKLRLVWETGEWDPVAGFYERDGEISDDDDDDDGMDAGGPPTGEQTAEADAEGKPGRWVKREVELRDGPRQLGYCVDGLDVTIRVEVR